MAHHPVWSSRIIKVKFPVIYQPDKKPGNKSCIQPGEIFMTEAGDSKNADKVKPV